MNRRYFIQTTALAATAGALNPAGTINAAAQSKDVHWSIGCFNRPWLGDKRKWSYDVALDGIKAAGYKVTGLLTRTANEPFTGSDATPEYLAELKKKIAARGLAVVMAALPTKDELPLDEQI